MIESLMPTYARCDLAFERGDGPCLYTQDGRRYLDFISGIGVVGLGHAHPKLVAALTEQAEKLWHTSNIFTIPGQARLAERLVAATFADTVFFTNSGTEAIECTLKMCRKYHSTTGAPERYRVIAFEGAFHGRSLAAIAAADKPKLTDGFGPVMDGFDQVPLGDAGAVAKAIGRETAGILLEPIQGEGGVIVADPGFLRRLRDIADEAGILLMLDEVQCGMGRTGKLFAHEWADIKPDIMAMAKAIGGGFPLGACLATEEAAQGMTAGSHGSTFGGNPLAMAVGNAVLDVMLEEDFLPRVAHLANYFKQQLGAVLERHPEVLEDLRGQGLMVGLKCKCRNTELLAALRERGLLAGSAGDNVLRLLPPLIIGEDHIREAIDILDQACAEVAQKSTAS